MGVDSSSGEESETPERVEEPPLTEPAPERATEPVKIEPDPTYEELHALVDQQEAEIAAEAEQDAREPEKPDLPEEVAPKAERDSAYEELRAKADRQEAEMAADEARLHGDTSSNESSDDEPSGGDAHAVDDSGAEGLDPTCEELQAPAEQQEAEPAAEELADSPPPSADGPQGLEAVAVLERRWEDHQARWPQEESAPVDRSRDERGSWRGDGGQYLNVEENIVTEHHYERVAEIRPKVTGALEEIKAEVPGAELVGLEYQLKGLDRYKEKVAEDLADTLERAVEKITPNIPDALRYTYQFDGPNYTEGFRSVCQRMEDRGFEMELSRNSWDDPDYKGINTRWRNEDGQMFEVQFHTPESFAAKQLTHGAYERLRMPPGHISPEEKAELTSFQRDVNSGVLPPDGVDGISDYRKKRS